MAETLILQDDLIRLGIDGGNGSIASILFKDLNLELIQEPRLADCFRINLRSEETESNYLHSTSQKLTGFELTQDALLLKWDGPLANDSGSYDITVTLQITLSAARLTFVLRATNHTGYELSEVWVPILGGLQGLGERKKTQAMLPVSGGLDGEDMFTHFRCATEYGIPVPEIIRSYPGQLGMQWCDIYNTEINRGVYLACHDRQPRFKSIRFELEPGAAHLRADNWMRADEVSGDIPTGLNTNWVFYPYTAINETFVSPEIVLQYHPGDWHAASAIYHAWFTSQFTLCSTDRWQHQEMSFMDTMFLLPEGKVLLKFKDMPAWIDSAKKHGVNAVLVSGWQTGGHDSSYPYYDPDPRLGALEELKAGIAYAHSVGVKVFFFINLQQVDTFTRIYRDDLSRYTISDQWGNAVPCCFGMGTVAARLNLTSRKLVNIDPAYKPFRDYLIEKFTRLIEIGADGFHLDKIAWSGPANSIDLNPRIRALGFAPDTAIWSGILDFCGELMQVGKKHHADFCLSIEGSWDRLLAYTDIAWMWHNPWEADHTCAIKYTFPQWTPCYAVTQPNDAISVNEAVRYGYQLFVGPMMYTSSMDDPKFSRLSAYIAEVNRLRASLRAIIYDGRFIDQQQVVVTGSSQHVRYKTFIDPQSGRRACIVVNSDVVAHPAGVRFTSSAGPYRVYQPFEESLLVACDRPVSIPAERFAIFVED